MLRGVDGYYECQNFKIVHLDGQDNEQCASRLCGMCRSTILVHCLTALLTSWSQNYYGNSSYTQQAKSCIMTKLKAPPRYQFKRRGGYFRTPRSHLFRNDTTWTFHRILLLVLLLCNDLLICVGLDLFVTGTSSIIPS